MRPVTLSAAPKKAPTRASRAKRSED